MGEWQGCSTPLVTIMNRTRQQIMNADQQQKVNMIVSNSEIIIIKAVQTDLSFWTYRIYEENCPKN